VAAFLAVVERLVAAVLRVVVAVWAMSDSSWGD
jgi:hypothetical protein